MAKQTNMDVFNEKTQSSDRELFDVDGFRLIDGESEIGAGNFVQSYFLFDDRENNIYEITLKEAYDLLAFYADKDVEEGVLCENIEELISEIDS